MSKQCPFGIECDSCRFFWNWHIKNEFGKDSFGQRCGFEVLFDEIPRLKGSIDGCQASANETRNRTMEFGQAAVETLMQIKNNVPKLLE